jgi:hypothetical protein
MGKVWQNVILEKYVSQEFEFRASLSGLYDEGSLGLNFCNVMINLAISNNLFLRSVTFDYELAYFRPDPLCSNFHFISGVKGILISAD